MTGEVHLWPSAGQGHRDWILPVLARSCGNTDSWKVKNKEKLRCAAKYFLDVGRWGPGKLLSQHLPSGCKEVSLASGLQS